MSLSGAAETLGMHPNTVRLWSDKGILPTHKTCGGHRRYKLSEISLWAESNSKSRDIEPERAMQEALKNIRMQISEGRLQAETWYQKLDEDARVQYRMSARSLFHGLASYIASNGADADAEAYAIGYEYASRARRYGLSYVDAARAFLFFRDALSEAIMKVYSDAMTPAAQAMQIYAEIHSFTDNILVNLLQVFESLEQVHC